MSDNSIDISNNIAADSTITDPITDTIINPLNQNITTKCVFSIDEEGYFHHDIFIKVVVKASIDNIN